MASNDTLTIISDGMELATWEEFSVTRGIEVMPSGFSAKVTEQGIRGREVYLLEGQPFQAKLGDDLVITGYLDDKQSYSAPGVHGVSITGSSKCEDLVDCSATVLGQIAGATALTLAEALAAPFGVNVTSKDGPGAALQTLTISVGETPFEVIERYAAYSGFLVYDGADGNLVLARLAEGRHGSGFVHGANVETISRSGSARQRYSEYQVYWQALVEVNDQAVQQANAVKARAEDENVPRYRPLKIVSDIMLPQADMLGSAQILANWHMWRRMGRSQQVRLTCSSWRDKDGKLWQPNHLVPLHAPMHGLDNVEWLIASVTYNKGRQGTTADLLLMPKEAFQVQPINPFTGNAARLERAKEAERDQQRGAQG